MNMRDNHGPRYIFRPSRPRRKDGLPLWLGIAVAACYGVVCYFVVVGIFST